MLSCQIDDENDDNENVPLNYYINNDLSIQFGREEFCLVTGLRFGVEHWEEYDARAHLPFRRRVFPSVLDGQSISGFDIANAILGPTFADLYNEDVVALCCLGILQLVLLGYESKRKVPEWLLRIANDRVAWDKYPWGSYVWPTLYFSLRNANVRRWGPLYVDPPANENDHTRYSLMGYTWAFKTWILESFRVTAIRYYDHFNRYPRVAAWNKKKGRFLAEMVISFFDGNIPVARLTPDDYEARSDWWISSRAYFDGFIDQVERGGMSSFKQPNFQTPMWSQPGSSDWQRQMPEQSASHDWQPSSQPGSYYSFGLVPSHMRRPNLQTNIEMQHDVADTVDQNFPNKGKRQQQPSKYLVSPFTVQPATTMEPKQRVSKTKNMGKKANLSPFNLGGVLRNVDPAKVRRLHYEDIMQFLNNPYQIYLDCYMKGYIVSVSFWQELAPLLCRPDMQRLPYDTSNGWLAGEHMNSWFELMIRRRPLNAN
ncbi:phospholipase-like protein [Tanacetum coccineum]